MQLHRLYQRAAGQGCGQMLRAALLLPYEPAARAHLRAAQIRRHASTKSTMAPKAKKGERGGPSAHYSSYVQVFNPGNGDSSASVLLFFDKERYLFNAGEGLQRLMREYKQRMSKMSTVLVTQVTPSTLGGLPGFLLSQVPMGQADSLNQVLALPGISAHAIGPRGLAAYAAAFKHYAGAVRVDVTETDGSPGCGPVVTSPVVTITPLALHPVNPPPPPATPAAEVAGSGRDGGGGAEADPSCPAAKRQRLEGPTPDLDSSSNSHPHPGTPAPAAAPAAIGGISAASAAGGRSQASGPVVAYLCQLATIPGKFDPVKAAQLGVPKGPMYGALQRGQPVTSITGAMVYPHQVQESPTTPGAVVGVLDLPTLQHLAAAQVQPQLEQLRQELLALQQQQQQQPEAGNGAANGNQAAAAAAAAGAPLKRVVLVHLGPQAVQQHPLYRSWLDSWGPCVHHCCAAPEAAVGSTLVRSAELQAHLAAFEPGVFPWTGFEQLEAAYAQQAQHAQQQQAAAEAAGQPDLPPGGVITTPHMFKITLAPAKHQSYGWESVPPNLQLKTLQEALWQEKPQLAPLLQQYQQQKAAALASPPHQQPGIPAAAAGGFALTLLGTISACPTNLRNVSGYYLDCGPGKGGALLDCGEDSYGQLVRRFGREGADGVLRTLRCVWISHMHADHHGGLYGVLLRRQALLEAAAAAKAAAAGAGAGVGGSDVSPAPDQSQQQQQQQVEEVEVEVEVEPLLVIGPLPLFRVMQGYSQVLRLPHMFAPSSSLYEAAAARGRGLPPPVDELYRAVQSRLGLTVLRPFPVEHIAHSSGLLVEGAAGWKLVMSGDTRPCQSVVDAARGATLLVHEATFEDELAGDALAKRHSTLSEALGVAAAAGAYRTVLTHFSGRYPKLMSQAERSGNGNGGEVEEAEGAAAEQEDPADPLAVLYEQGGGGQHGVAGGGGGGSMASAIVGFDLMTIRSEDLGWLPLLLPLVDELCSDEAGEVTAGDEGGEE